MKVVSILSGGLDSTTALYKAVNDGADITSAVSFNYGQRHKKELDYAATTAEVYGIRHHIIDLWASGLTNALSSSTSSLIDGGKTAIPEGHYAEESMKATVVPNRNMMMISIAGAIAVAEGADAVMVGVHAGDHAVYPDCRPEFVSAAGMALYLGNEGFGNLKVAPVYAPFVHNSKDDIAVAAIRLGVPLHRTWSCYKGGDIHCGRCGTCVERLEAIHNAQERIASEQADGMVKSYDHTEYEDSKYWQEVLSK